MIIFRSAKPVSNVFVVYPPGAGGNHLKNLLCLSGAFINSNDLDPAIYDAEDRAPGEVWSVGGRNLQSVFFDRIWHNPGSRSILTAHFGELVAQQSQFDQVPDRKLIIITMAQAQSRQRLMVRQTRLGQNVHSYWLDEELVHCYRTAMYARFFGVSADCCFELELQELWSHDLWQNQVIDRLEQFLAIRVPDEPARGLHQKWMQKNFSAFHG